MRYDKLTIDKNIDPMGVYCVAQKYKITPLLNALKEGGLINPQKKKIYKKVMIVACRLSSWIGLSGIVEQSVALKYNFKKTRKYGKKKIKKIIK